MPSPPASSAFLNLRRLLGVRLVLLPVLMLLLVFVRGALGLPLPLPPLATVIALWAVVTIIGWLRLRRDQHGPGTGRMATQLMVDIAGLTALLYLSGGWTNPLVSLYLVPIAVAAVTLPARTTWLLAALATLAYTAIALIYRPVIPTHVDTAGGFALHITGMWLTFVVSAAMVAYFGTTMAATLRERERVLAAAREGTLRNEQIIGVATLAAGTAHELSTPLASIAVIASELEARSNGDALQDLKRLLGQVEVCRDVLSRLRGAAEPVVEDVDAAALLHDVCTRFVLLRPSISLTCSLPEESPAPLVHADETLKQAFLNLLDNAANASPDAVELVGRWDGDGVQVDILDRGAGFPDAGGIVAEDRSGLGVGLMLANATVERLGGTVYASARKGAGTRVRVRLPVARQPKTDP